MTTSTPERRYGPTSGGLLGVLGLLLCAATLVYVVVGGIHQVSARVGIATLAAAVLIWAYLLRPRIIVEAGGDTLVLRNPIITYRIPLSAVRMVGVKVVTTVKTADARYDAVAVGYSLRKVIRSGRAHTGASPLVMQPQFRMLEPPPTRRVERAEQDVMTEHVLAAAQQARERGLADSPVVRTVAVPELVALAALAVAFLVTFLV